jgi:hypothetical protein
MIKSGTRRELPDGELFADRVLELMRKTKVSTRCGRNSALPAAGVFS